MTLRMGSRALGLSRAGMWALSLILVVSGVGKMLAPERLSAVAIPNLGVPLVYWNQIVAFTQAVGVLEAAVGIVVLMPRRFGDARLLLWLLIAAFVVFDVVRALSGGDADCGCLGSMIRLDSWWAVAAKHCLMTVLVVLYGQVLSRHYRRESTTELRVRTDAAMHVELRS